MFPRLSMKLNVDAVFAELQKVEKQTGVMVISADGTVLKSEGVHSAHAERVFPQRVHKPVIFLVCPCR